ncbi:hypothetical protein Cpir12675_003387 [Ceratocystis pirilliformis]|uniref:Trichothecene 3-O-acetyltransferase-like N-terminal domain-containing protein n=1 Tax=Ceratocystis pirilliformis TaxID=259994 RepID=A0ABR3Z475_9PEZI
MPSSDKPYRLSAWDQAASRAHVRLAICFDLRSSTPREEIVRQLKSTLSLLAHAKPYYAGRLFLGPRLGWAYMHEAADYSIPLEAHDESKSFGMTYEQFRQDGFPAHATVHPRYYIDGTLRDYFGEGDGVPVIVIRAFFVNGGLVLSIFFHHTFGDGDAMGKFIEDFAQQSRSSLPIPTTIQDRDLSFTGFNDPCDYTLSAESLFKACPEYVYEPKQLGPNNSVVGPGGISPDEYPKTGRTFVFHKDSIDRLRTAIRSQLNPDADAATAAAAAAGSAFPSAYVALAALTWVHTANARRIGESHIEQPISSDQNNDAGSGALINPVNWAYRTFRDTHHGYTGNAVMLARTKIPVCDLAVAADDMTTLAGVAAAINMAINFDETFVRTRLQLADHVDDPRNIMLSFDARIREDFAFNTWRDFGADCEWDLLGDGRTVKADALRRPQPDWNLVGSLILPARQSSKLYEIVITIPAPSMEVLVADDRYTKWTRRIVG